MLVELLPLPIPEEPLEEPVEPALTATVEKTALAGPHPADVGTAERVTITSPAVVVGQPAEYVMVLF